MLAGELPNSLLFDAEEVGFMLRNILHPIDWSGDFQNYPMWRTLTVEVARGLKENYGRTLIMPMTIRRKDYFDEVMTGLASIDPEVHHFCLTASADAICSRVRTRGEQPAGDWIFDQIEKCVSAFNSELFAEKIDTDKMSPHQTMEYIVSRITKKSA
jgi:hypothetical protein